MWQIRVRGSWSVVVAVACALTLGGCTVADIGVPDGWLVRHERSRRPADGR